jgi:anti-sigma factor RsiW
MKTTSEHEPSEHDLHAYVDGRLAPERERVVEAWLKGPCASETPERAAEIHAWRRDAQQLRAALGAPDDLAANPALDPSRIRARRSAQSRARLAFAAALMICTGAGTLGGWQLRAWHDDFVPTMTDALEAHRMFSPEGALNPDIVPRDANDMQAWMDQHFTAAPKVPDLTPAGFRPVGGRLFATEMGPAALVLYRDAHGGVISFYMRPASPRFVLPHGENREGALLAQYEPISRYWVAMVSRADGRDPSIVQRALPTSDSSDHSH